ncbi:MAG: carboxymuconolactone decarboxylase family protein [Sneathiella sp.]|nr:carboxymuconolactone decarboxylase family protein [Sneathiella sp.]
MKTRITPLKSPFSAEVEADFNTIMPPGMPPLSIFKTVAHNPRVLHRMIMGGLLDKGSISLADRELVILRTCGLCKAEYEWGVHVAVFSSKAGFNKLQIRDTTKELSDLTLWNPEQELLIQLADQLHVSNQVNDDLWARLSRNYKSEQLIELIMITGLYHAVSFMVNACRVERELFAPTFSDFSD